MSFNFPRKIGTWAAAAILPWSLVVLMAPLPMALLAESPAQSTDTASPQLIDLPTALRLAGAQNLDVQIARETLREVDANHSRALEQFFPWVAPGFQYHRRDGLAQAVPAGTISSAHYESYSPGAMVAAQVNLGDALFNTLAAKQLVQASGQALETQRQEAILSAAQAYFELAKAKGLVQVAGQALGTSEEYREQLHAAVTAGVAFRGDELRVKTQSERYRIAISQALEKQRFAGAQLAQILHLNPVIELSPKDSGLSRLTLVAANLSLDFLVQRARFTRPEVKENAALVAASRANRNAARFGPLIPSIGGQAFVGGLGGGPDHGPGRFGAEEDYLFAANWRIGPGGLFDFDRIKASQAQSAAVELRAAKLCDRITFEVVSGLNRVRSLSDQIALLEQSLIDAAETQRLTHERKQFGVGLVLEEIQSQQELTQARSDYISTLAELNKAQYELNKATGGAATDSPQVSIHPGASIPGAPMSP